VKGGTSSLDGMVLCHHHHHHHLSLVLGAERFSTWKKCVMLLQEVVVWKMMNDAWCVTEA